MKTAIGHGVFIFPAPKSGAAFPEGCFMKLTSVAVLGLAVLAAPAASRRSDRRSGPVRSPLQDVPRHRHGRRPADGQAGCARVRRPPPKSCTNVLDGLATCAAGMSDADKRDIAVFPHQEGPPPRQGRLPGGETCVRGGARSSSCPASAGCTTAGLFVRDRSGLAGHRQGDSRPRRA